MTRLSLVLALSTLATVAMPARAQYPGGGGGYGRPGGRGGAGGGMQQQEDPDKRTKKRDTGPKSEELVDVRPLLRGVKLTAPQDSTVKAINERYEPQLLPIYDWLKEQKGRREDGQDVDMELVKRRFARADVLRRQQLAEIRTALRDDQQVRFDKNVADERKQAAEDAARGRP